MTTAPVALRRGHPLTPFQRRILASQRRAPGSPLQNMALLSHLDGPIDPARFTAAFARTVALHESLRTRIDADAAEPIAVVTDDDAITVAARSVPATVNVVCVPTAGASLPASHTSAVHAPMRGSSRLPLTTAASPR